MQITDVRVRIVDGNAKMKAVASITLDEAFAIHDIKVIEGEKESGAYLLQCRTRKCQMVNTVMLHIRFIVV